MSLIKSATRRLSLLASSSLAVAGAVSMSSALAVFTPTMAYAHDECAPLAGSGTQSDGQNGAHDPTLNGNAPDTFQCTSRRSSITYNSVGTTGLLTINLVSSNIANGFASSAGTLGGMTTNPGGDVVINMGANTLLLNGASFGLSATTPTGTTTTVNLADHPADTSNLGASENAYLRGWRATGSGDLVINNDGLLSGNVNLSGLTGSHTLNITANGAWYSGWQDAEDFTPVTATSVLAAGDDSITVSEGGMVYASTVTSEASSSAVITHVIDFREATADLDVFSLAGHLAVNPNRQFVGEDVEVRTFGGVVRMDGLEEFRNSGVVLLGSVQSTTPQEDTTPAHLLSDGWYDDVLSLPGATWIGDGGQVVMNVDIMRTQSDCTTRNAAADLGAADCLMIVGGATEGLTYLTLNEVVPGDRGRYHPEGIVLVDVTDGVSAQGHFVVGPDSANYSPEFGGVLDKGLFFYAVTYNEDTQQHILYGLPGANAQQFPLLATASQGLWRQSTGTWFDRQADLRGEQEPGVGGGVWLRVNGEKAERDIINAVSAGGQTYAIDNTFTQEGYAATVGADLLFGAEGATAYALGVMAGYAHADIEYETSPNTGRLDGWTGGAYGTFISGGFFLDAAVNLNKLTVDDDVPSLALFPAGTILSTDVVSVGFQAETGLRFPFDNGLFIEPIAGLSYVQTKFDDIDVPADDPARPRILIEYDDPASLRGSLGGRLGWDADYGSFRTQLSLLGRVVEEFDGANNIRLDNEGPDVLLTDDFSGRFTEFTVGGSIYSAGGAVSGFFNFGGKFGDDYKATTLSAGVRAAF
ncbi:MAG TPA: autotransporter outer membrane beta-barrel domain-containing protein [Caulobacteraceae bacterium]|nr:autotransporter outer membrane beta-barrel domain-containing protein [Caulobacteraceae bacterium]